MLKPRVLFLSALIVNGYWRKERQKVNLYLLSVFPSFMVTTAVYAATWPTVVPVEELHAQFRSSLRLFPPSLQKFNPISLYSWFLSMKTMECFQFSSPFYLRYSEKYRTSYSHFREFLNYFKLIPFLVSQLLTQFCYFVSALFSIQDYSLCFIVRYLFNFLINTYTFLSS